MARHPFGGSPSDYAMERVGNQLLVRPAAVGTVWDAATGGTQLTDLTTLTGTPITEVTADTDGAVYFMGPDGVTDCYIDFGYTRRFALAAVNTGEVLADFIAQGGEPGGWAQLDGSGSIDSSQIPAQLDWIVVRSYGALGDGAHDDTTAIQNAINACPPGGVVYFPRGVYKTTATLDLGNGVTLIGSHANLMVGPGMTGAEYQSFIQPATPFTGTSVIQIIGDATVSGHPDISGEQRLTNLMLDGSQLTGTSIDGLYAKGNVQNVVLDNVTIRQMPNNGIVTADRTDGKCPFSWRLHHVMIDNCHANGILFTGNTDVTLDDVQVIGCWAQGIVLTNCTNAQLQACRTEWNGSHGYRITGNWGDWAGSGGMQMTGCSTDRNGQHGVLVDATGQTPLVITGLMTRRDGRNGGAGGGGFAGLGVAAATIPILVTNMTCYPGVDDNGTQTNSPQYGVSVTGSSGYVQLDAAILHAAIAGLNDDGTSTVILGDNITYATGATTAPVRAPQPDAAPTNNDLKYAIELTGSSGSNVSLGVKTYLNGQPFTFGTWVDFYGNALTDDGAVWSYGYSSGNDKGYSARVDGTTKRLAFFWGATQVTAVNTFCYGKMWLVLAYDGATTLKVYKNNVLMDTLAITARTADATVGSYLGTRDGSARNLNGALDDSFLYNRVLTASELTAIFRTATFPSSGNLFRYRFDERTGTTATDSSGSGNTGTINSGTYRVSEFGNTLREPSAPTTWQASLANADLTKTCALFIGSSTTQGSLSSALDNRYTDVLGQLLHKQFNSTSVTGGKHVRAGDTGWSTTGTASLNGDGLGLASYALSAGATLSRTMTNCTGFDLHFVQGPGQGAFSYQVDGGSAVVVTPNTTGTANRHDGTVTVTGLTLGSHTLQINATNACIINGVYVHNGDATSGVRIYNSGKGSTASADFITTNANTIWQRAAAIGNVNLVALMLSSNDFSASVNPSIFKTNLATIIHNTWNNLGYRPDIVLINSYRRYDQVGYGTTYLYGQYADKMQELAGELDRVQYVDLAGLFPLMNDSIHDPLDLMNADSIHMNDAGHRYMARLLMRSLTPSIA